MKTLYKRGTSEKYVFTGLRGDMAVCQSTSEIYHIKKGDQLLILRSETHHNGEPHITTSIGLLPSVLFYENMLN